MKILTLWAEATVKPAFVLLAMIAILMTGTSAAWAYETYSTSADRNSGNCADCHGNFRTSPYISASDGANWGDDLHDVHRNDMLDGDCSTCHAASGRYPVSLESSAGGSGLSPISCVGCHGREQDIGNDSGRGAGLRQHHTRAGESDCTDCHSDAILANYTPVDENILPNYYANPGNNHPAMPTNSCNPAATTFVENFAGTTLGLDNDGDSVAGSNYDMADPDCEGFPVELMTFEIE